MFCGKPIAASSAVISCHSALAQPFSQNFSLSSRTFKYSAWKYNYINITKIINHIRNIDEENIFNNFPPSKLTVFRHNDKIRRSILNLCNTFSKIDVVPMNIGLSVLLRTIVHHLLRDFLIHMMREQRCRGTT